MIVMATIVWQISLVSESMDAQFGLNFQTIASIVLGLAATGLWVLYAFVGINSNDFVRTFMPIANSIFTMFTLGFIFNYVIELNCP